MKRIGFLAALSLAVSLVALSQLGCQPAADTNRAGSTAATANTNAASEVVDTAAIQDELMRLENDWPRVLKEKDAAAVRRVEADDLFVIYPDGSVGGKAQDVKDMENGALSADSWQISELKVAVLDKDAAFASGRSVVKGGKYKTPEGKTTDISGEYRFIDTFARRNGEWKLVASASTPVKPGAMGPPSAKASPAAKASPTGMASPMPTRMASPSPKPKSSAP